MSTILVACEFSGVVREAFGAAYPHYRVVSCDFLDTEQPCSQNTEHYKGDVREILAEPWQLMIAHPPCTYLANSGARWFDLPGRSEMQAQALAFVSLLLSQDHIPYICVENPVGVISTQLMRPTQYIQPFDFGEPVRKKTGLWLKNLPRLEPQDPIPKECAKPSIHWEAPGEDRWRNRSRFFPKIARAMAMQWACVLNEKEKQE